MLYLLPMCLCCSKEEYKLSKNRPSNLALSSPEHLFSLVFVTRALFSDSRGLEEKLNLRTGKVMITPGDLNLWGQDPLNVQDSLVG